MEIYLPDTKTGDGIVILHTIAAEAIKDYIENERTPSNKGEKALFLSKRGERISERFVRDNLKQCAVEAGITRRVYPHITCFFNYSYVKCWNKSFNSSNTSTTQLI